MALYKDGNPVSGLNSIPRLTLAQYNALNVKPEFWVRTDAPESYKKLSADQVSYDSNNTVKDKLDELSPSIWEYIAVGNRNICVRKMGAVTQFFFWTDATFTDGQIIANLPQKYRPSVPVYPNYLVTNNVYNFSNMLNIKPNGDVIMSGGTGSGWKLFSLTWITD